MPVLVSYFFYTYDIFNRKIARSEDPDGDGSASVETVYTINNGDDIWRNENNVDLTHTMFLYSDSIDRPIGFAAVSITSVASVSLYVTDHLETVRGIIDVSTESLTSEILYDSFGNVITPPQDAMPSSLAFTSREFDETTGFHYYRARNYDSTTGRFLGVDPLGLRSGDTNTYRYTGNTPTQFRDPSGLVTAVERANLRTAKKILQKAANCLATLGVQAVVTEVAVTGVYVYVAGIQSYGGKSISNITGRLGAHRRKLATLSKAIGPAARLAISTTDNKLLLQVEQWVIDQLKTKGLNPTNVRSPNKARHFKC
jgi:RHS repeat-associated protein